MVLASHATFGCHGFWLPNDRRGSWSNQVWAKHLKPFGPATKTTERRSLANKRHDRTKRMSAKAALEYPAVTLDDLQRNCVARGFQNIAATVGIVVYACAIMPDHVHLVIARHDEHVETLVGFLKRAASRQLREEGLHPLAGYMNRSGRVPSPWADGGWNRFINATEQIPAAIDYVERNPEKIGLRRQHWSFVARYPNV